MFNLSSYTREITNAMRVKGWSAEVAVNNFVVNLNTFREYFDFGGTVNFHEIGRDWVRLPSSVRLDQRHSLIAKLSRQTMS